MRQQPELKVEEVPVADLVPYIRNAKRHDDAQVRTIASSIEEFGNCDPVAVWTNADGEPEIVEGHGRVLALKKLGVETVPVIHLDHLTDEQRRAYTHVHNQTTLNSGFDLDLLEADMFELPDFDWEGFGFDEDFDAIGDMVSGAEFCASSLDGTESGEVSITFVFGPEDAENVKAYVKDRGKDEIAAQIAEEARRWG